MSSKREYCIPFVGAIIERDADDRYILVQTRMQTNGDPLFNGTLEIPQGTMDKLYENVYDTLEREIFEETGLVLSKVIDGEKSVVYGPQANASTFGFKPFYCVQQLSGGKPWVGFIFRCKVKEGNMKAQVGESADIRWMHVDEIRSIMDNSPQNVFTLDFPALDYYLKSRDL